MSLTRMKMNLQGEGTHFHMNGFRTKTSSDTEPKGNSEWPIEVLEQYTIGYLIAQSALSPSVYLQKASYSDYLLI